MRRYWIPKEMRAGETVVLTGDTLHHIRDVCRMHLGSKFEVIVEGGEAHLVEIMHEGKKDSLARIIETRRIPDLAQPHIHLALAIPKIQVFEAIVEKAVEMGVKSIQPLYSEYSFIRARSELFDKKRARFERIVLSATQQCGRGELMSIEEPVTLAEGLTLFKEGPTGGRGLFAFEGDGELTAREGLGALTNRSEATSDVWIFVGAEGGFSEPEVVLFKANGLEPITLGSQVLRVETACVTLVAIIKYAFDLMR